MDYERIFSCSARNFASAPTTLSLLQSFYLFLQCVALSYDIMIDSCVALKFECSFTPEADSSIVCWKSNGNIHQVKYRVDHWQAKYTTKCEYCDVCFLAWEFPRRKLNVMYTLGLCPCIRIFNPYLKSQFLCMKYSKLQKALCAKKALFKIWSETHQ